MDLKRLNPLNGISFYSEIEDVKSFIFFIFFIFSTDSILASGDADLRSIHKAQEALNKLNNQNPTCENCTYADQPKSCFPFLDKMQKDDYLNVITIDRGAHECMESTRVPSVSGRFSKALDLQNQYQQMYPELGNLNHNQIKACISDPNEPDEKKRYRVSQFYYFMKRFNEGATRAYEELSAINDILPDDETLNCVGKGTLPQAYTRCEDLKKNCAPKDTKSEKLNALAKQSEKDEKDYLDSKKAIKDLSNGCLELEKDYDRYAKNLSATKPSLTHCTQGVGTRDFTKVCRTYTHQQKQEMASCRAMRDTATTVLIDLEGKNPWFRSDNYFELRKEKPVKEALQKHLATNRTELKKKIDEFQNAGLCMNGFLDEKNCEIKKIRALTIATPEIPEIEDRNQKKLAASIYLNAQMCVNIKNEFSLEATKTLSRSALDASLTLITGGIGIAALKGAQALRAAKSLPNVTVLAKNQAFLTMMVINAFYATESYGQYTDACIETKKKIEIATASENKSCPGPQSNIAQAQKNHNGCIMAKAFLAMDALPLATGYYLLSRDKILYSLNKSRPQAFKRDFSRHSSRTWEKYSENFPLIAKSNIESQSEEYIRAINSNHPHIRFLESVGYKFKVSGNKLTADVPPLRSVVNNIETRMQELVKSGRIKAEDALMPARPYSNNPNILYEKGQIIFLRFDEKIPDDFTPYDSLLYSEDFSKALKEGKFPLGALNNEIVGSSHSQAEHDLAHFSVFLDNPELMAEIAKGYRTGALNGAKQSDRMFFVLEVFSHIPPSNGKKLNTLLESQGIKIKDTGNEFISPDEIAPALSHLNAEQIKGIFNSISQSNLSVPLGGVSRDLISIAATKKDFSRPNFYSSPIGYVENRIDQRLLDNLNDEQAREELSQAISLLHNSQRIDPATIARESALPSLNKSHRTFQYYCGKNSPWKNLSPRLFKAYCQ